MHSNNLLEIQPDHGLIAFQTVHFMLLALQCLSAESALIFPLGPFHNAVYVVIVATICLEAIPTVKTNRTWGFIFNVFCPSLLPQLLFVRVGILRRRKSVWWVCINSIPRRNWWWRHLSIVANPDLIPWPSLRWRLCSMNQSSITWLTNIILYMHSLLFGLPIAPINSKNTKNNKATNN